MAVFPQYVILYDRTPKLSNSLVSVDGATYPDNPCDPMIAIDKFIRTKKTLGTVLSVVSSVIEHDGAAEAALL